MAAFGRDTGRGGHRWDQAAGPRHDLEPLRCACCGSSCRCVCASGGLRVAMVLSWKLRILWARMLSSCQELLALCWPSG